MAGGDAGRDPALGVRSVGTTARGSGRGARGAVRWSRGGERGAVVAGRANCTVVAETARMRGSAEVAQLSPCVQQTGRSPVAESTMFRHTERACGDDGEQDRARCTRRSTSGAGARRSQGPISALPREWRGSGTGGTCNGQRRSGDGPTLRLCGAATTARGLKRDPRGRARKADAARAVAGSAERAQCGTAQAVRRAGSAWTPGTERAVIRLGLAARGQLRAGRERGARGPARETNTARPPQEAVSEHSASRARTRGARGTWRRPGVKRATIRHPDRAARRTASGRAVHLAQHEREKPGGRRER